MIIREALDSDFDAVMSVERVAFGSDEEAGLVADLLVDPSARPMVSLLAFDGDRSVGHILFTWAGLVPDSPLTASILAPLAVVPDKQKKGIGGALIEHGFSLDDSSVESLISPSFFILFSIIPFSLVPVLHNNLRRDRLIEQNE